MSSTVQDVPRHKEGTDKTLHGKPYAEVSQFIPSMHTKHNSLYPTGSKIFWCELISFT